MCKPDCDFYGHKYGDKVEYTSASPLCKYCGCVVEFGPGKGTWVWDTGDGSHVVKMPQLVICPECNAEHLYMVYFCGPRLDSEQVQRKQIVAVLDLVSKCRVTA